MSRIVDETVEVGSWCKRCGARWSWCNHNANCRSKPDEVDDAHAERIRARYGMGKRLNPDHDSTSYMDKGR
jgi:hypothetical protein